MALLPFAVPPAALVYASGEQSDPAAPFLVIEANDVSVTVSVSKAGDIDSQRTFKITDASKVMIDGQPASAADIKGGMYASITTAADGNTVTCISAHDAPKR